MFVNTKLKIFYIIFIFKISADKHFYISLSKCFYNKCDISMTFPRLLDFIYGRILDLLVLLYSFPYYVRVRTCCAKHSLIYSLLDIVAIVNSITLIR